jgi:RND family efflux transporter MFP subunit
MKSKLATIGLPVAILVIAAGVTAAMISLKTAPEKKELEQKPLLVDVISVEKQDLNFIIKSQGTAQAKTETILSAQVSGQIVSVADYFIEGGMFKKGDVLVQIEKADYETEFKLAEADLARAEADLLEERAQGKVAAEDWKAITDAPAPELGLRKPQLAREIANVKAAEAKLERARRNLERTTLRAPYDGLVKEKNVDIGQFVGQGQQLGTLFSTQVAEIRVPLSDSDLAYLQLPSEGSERSNVTLRAKVAGKEQQWKGYIVRSEGIFDEQSRMLYAVIEINDPYLRAEGASGIPLKFGRFLQAEIIGNKGEGLVVVPRDVLRLDGTVLVLDENEQLSIRKVSVQRADEVNVYISEGLQNQEKIIVSAVPNPVAGLPLRVIDGETAPLPMAAASGE